MNKIEYFLPFTVGILTGSIVTWIFTKKKYEQIVQQEISSVKKVFSKRESDLETFEEIVKQNNYASESDNSDRAEKQDTKSPYVIKSDDFGELPDYEKITLIYYSDRVLADDNCERIDNVIDTVGTEFQNHFGENNEDAVYVRNEQRKCDYEILLVTTAYSELLKTKPWLEVSDE